jgi:hypothetical protein
MPGPGFSESALGWERMQKMLDRYRAALLDIQEEVRDNIDYCSETGHNLEGRIYVIAEAALYPGGR